MVGTNAIQLNPVLTCNPASNLKANQYINPSCFANFATPGEQGTYIFPTITGPGFWNHDLSVFKNFLWGNSENKKLQFRFSGYNFLNHPVRTFTSGDNALKLSYDQSGKLVDNGGVPFGYALNKTGHRIIQGDIKFTF